MESNKEQTVADAERAMKEAKEAKRIAYRAFRAARGRYHIELMARRAAGAEMTIADMKAYEDAAIDSIGYVHDAYLALNQSNVKADQAEIAYNESVRVYWDNRQDEKRGIFK